MQALVGQALIEIRATWEGVAADTRAALAEVEGQIAATEARIGASVGGTVSEVEASSKAMAANVAASTAAAASASEALVGVLGEDANAFVATAAAAGIASEAQGALSSTAAALRETLRGTIIDEARLAEASADVAAGTRTATEGIALMRAEAARLAASAKVSAIDTANLGDESEVAAAKMLTEAQAAQVVAATATELKAQLSALAVVTSAELSRLGEAIAFAAGQLAPLSLGLANLGAGVTFGTAAITEFESAMALATIQTGQFVLSTEATSAASTAFTAEIQRQIAAQEQLNFATASRLAMNAAVAQSDAEVAAATAAATREQSALSAAVGASTGSVEINTAAQRRNTEVVGSAVTADRARLAGLSRLAAVVAASTVQTDAEAVALLKALGAKEKDIAATMAELVAAGEWTAALNTQNAAIASNAAAKKSASAVTKEAAASEAMFTGTLGDAAIQFNFLTRTIRNSLFIITGLEAATAAVTIKMAEEQNKLLNLSQQFGIASDEISGFSLLSKATGESIDTINTSLRMMQKGFAGVGDGSNLAQQAFAALGIQTAKTGATARDTASIFNQVADVMALIPDGEQKIAVGTAIMGRSFNAVIPLINQGSAGMARMTQASRELGTELTTLEMLTSHGIVTAWTDFKGAIQGVGFAIEKELAPSILSAITTTTQWIAANRELVASKIAGFVRTVGSAFGDAVVFVSQNIGAMKELALVAAGATAAYRLLTSETLANAAVTLTSLGRMEALKLTVSTVAGSISTAISGAIQPLTSILSGPLVIALAAASAGILSVVHHQVDLADKTDRAAQSIRDFQTALNRLTPKQREEQSTVRALQAEYNALGDQIDIAKENLEALKKATSNVTPVPSDALGITQESIDATTSAVKTQEEQLKKLQARYAQVGSELDKQSESSKKAASAESALTQKAIEEETARLNLLDAFKKLQDGRGLDIKQIELVEKATGEEVEALQQEFKKKELSTNASKGFAQALGMEEKFVVKAVKIHEDLGLADDKAGKAAERAAAQVDKFNASAAKATAQEMATQVNSLANELSRLSLPEAIERLPALLNLNAQALDAEVAAIRAETETKLGAAKTEEARNAALAEEADRIQKATVANELHAQKLVDTVTHTESAAKITEEYAKTLRSLQEAQDALKITVIDDQIKAITDSWKNLDIATRQSQLPQVLTLLEEKYKILGEKATEANEALVENARKQYDSAEAAYALTGSEEDLASMVAALNALWGVTETVQANAALSAEDLAAKLKSEEKAAREAAAGTNDLAQAQQLAAGMASDLSKALVDLITTGSFKDLGKQLFAQLLDQSLVPFVENGLKEILGPAIKGALGGTSFGDVGSKIGSGLSSAVGSAMEPAILSLSGGLAKNMTELVGLGMDQAAGGIFSLLESGFGSVVAEGITAALGATGTVAAVGLGVAGIGVAIAAAFGAFEGPTMVEQIASHLSEMFKASFKSDTVRTAINEGLQVVDLYLGEGLERLMIRAPKDMGKQVADAWRALGTDSSYQFSDGFYQDMREKGKQLIHTSVDDVMHALYPAIAPELYDSIENASIAAGTAIAAGMGLVGDKAIKFAEEWAVAFVGMMQAAGKSAEEIDKALKRIDSSLGTSAALKEAFDALRDALINAGVDMNALFDNISAQIGKVNGKKVHIGDLDDVLAATGNNATVALGMIENGLDALGIPIERFTGQLSDVVLAISGDAGTAIRDASKDMEDFGNYSDGTAQIIEQKVVAALGNVVKTAEQLGYTPESIEALGTAASLISPELLKSDAVVQALHDSFAQMAVGAHMSIRELIDSIDPPLEQSVRDAILAVDDLAAALGSLSDAPLSSLKEVTDRMKQFAGDMYREVKDSEGKVSKELTAFGEQLVKDAVSAIGGMWDTITADGVIDPSDIQAVFEQLAQIPEEVLGDSSVQSSIQSLLAMIGEQTGDAFIIGLSALPEVTKAQLDEALGIYDQWKKDVEDQPVQPEVQPTVEPATNPDGTPANKALDDATTATDGLTTSTTGAKTATDDLTTSLQDLEAQAAGLAGAGGQTITDALGLTPEAAAAVTNITAGLSTAASGATDMAAAVTTSLQDLEAQAAGLAGAGGQTITDALGLTPEALDDATTATDGLTTSTTGAKTATDDLTTSLQDLEAQAAGLAGAGGQTITDALGLTPEAAAAVTNITAGLSTAASGATEMATAVQAVTESVSGSTDEFAALAKAAGMSSEQVRAAIQPIIGAEDDGQSLVATQAALSSITTFLPEEMVPGFADFETDASLAVSGVFGKVGELQSALSALVTNGPYEVSVVTHYTADGEPPQATQQPPPMAVGGWIPGAIGSPYPITAHGQELVVPASTATTLPPSLVDALLSGTAFRMPADFAPRLSPVAVGNTDPAQSATAPDPDFVAVRMSKADAAAAMYAPLMVMVERDSRNGMVRFKDGKAKIHPHLRARARRG